MNSILKKTWLAASILVCVSAMARPAADEPRYFVAQGRTLAKSFVQHSELKLVEMRIETPDGPQEPEEGVPDMSIVDDETIEFQDESLKVGDDGPRKLKRTYTTIENTQVYEGGGEDDEDVSIENKSGLDGKTVLFSWDEDEEAFEPAWLDCEGDDDLLEELVAAADFRSWLGEERKLSEGDTWKIPASEFNNLQEPSGPMGYVPEGTESEEEDDGTSKALRENLKGEINATYKGTREEDGVLVGVIALEGKVESSAEAELEQEEGPSVLHAIETSSEFEGELLWDWSAGHFRKLSVDSEMSLSISDKLEFEIQGNSISIKQLQRFAGKKTYRFSCAPKQD
jgi:hypothetical protein